MEASDLTNGESEESVTHTFQVTVPTAPGEIVCVTGDQEALGNWDPFKMLSLSLGHETVIENGAVEVQSNQWTTDGLWTGSVVLPKSAGIVNFRYVITIVVPDQHHPELQNRMIIRKWEADIHCRQLNLHSKPKPTSDVFGENLTIMSGWLTHQHLVEFQLHTGAIKFWTKIQKEVRIKVTALDLSEEGAESAGDLKEYPSSWPILDVAVIDPQSQLPIEDSEFMHQDEGGTAYNPSAMMIYQFQLFQPQTVAFRFQFLVDADDPEEPAVELGVCLVLPRALKGSSGRLQVPIIGNKGRLVGELKVDYVLVHPMADAGLSNLSVSYARHWRTSWQGLDVGHRGSGNSECLKEFASVRENTIASLRYAAEHGADMVEFDVHLSKDHVPVVFHDFHLCIAVGKKKQKNSHGRSPKLEDEGSSEDERSEELLQVALKDLTLQQLQMLRTATVFEKDYNVQRDGEEDLLELQPFPTLEQVLGSMDDHVAFNIEVKWTMELKDSTFELDHPFDLNFFIDKILEVVMLKGGSRKIIFSGFHPDVCNMIRVKQNKYPVMFLTQGVTSRYPALMDPRTHTVKMAVQFVHAYELLGVVAHTEDLLRDPSLVNMVTAQGQILFCWGDENNNSDNIRKLKKWGVHAVIYDKMYIYNERPEKQSIFLADKEAIMNGHSLSPNACQSSYVRGKKSSRSRGPDRQPSPTIPIVATTP